MQKIYLLFCSQTKEDVFISLYVFGSDILINETSIMANLRNLRVLLNLPISAYLLRILDKNGRYILWNYIRYE